MTAVPITATTLLGLPLVDVAVIVAYFAVVLWIGYRSMKRIKSQEDYFLAGRRFGKFIQTFAAFGQGTSAESAVNTTTKVSQDGVAGVGASGLATGLLILPPLWMTTLWYRRMRLLSLADFFEERYGSKAMAGFYAICQAIFFVIVAAMGFVAMSKTVAAIAVIPETALSQSQIEERQQAAELDELRSKDYRLLDANEKEQLDRLTIEKPRRQFSYINERILMVVIAIIVLLYAVSGGLEAAFITDTLQGVLIIALTLILIPFAMIRINDNCGTTGLLGPFEAMHRELPDSFFDLFGSPQLAEVTWYWLLTFALLGVVNTLVQANQLTAAGSAKDDETARVGFVTGIFIKRYCTVIWAFVAMMTTVLYGQSVSDPDYIWGSATRDLLGPLGIGLVGLMIACLMAALMSTADALMLTTAALLTRSVYRPLVPGQSDRHYVWAGRAFCLVYIVGGVLIAMYLTDVFKLFKYMLMFNSIVAAAFLMGMLWRRATRAAAWTSMIVTFAFTLLLPVVIPLFPGVRDNPYLSKMTEPVMVAQTYVAKRVDVTQRQQAIDVWEQLQVDEQAKAPRPKPIQVGERFAKNQRLAGKSIFWSEGVELNKSGPLIGQGMLKVELVALDLLGWDLAANRYSFNETLTFLARLLIPFGTIGLVSLMTRPEEKLALDRFFGKMRTAVNADPEADLREMALTHEDPTRFDHLKLFPDSNWEFRRWNRRDWIGQGYVFLGIVGIAVMLFGLARIGS